MHQLLTKHSQKSTNFELWMAIRRQRRSKPATKRYEEIINTHYIKYILMTLRGRVLTSFVLRVRLSCITAWCFFFVRYFFSFSPTIRVVVHVYGTCYKTVLYHFHRIQLRIKVPKCHADDIIILPPHFHFQRCFFCVFLCFFYLYFSKEQ